MSVDLGIIFLKIAMVVGVALGLVLFLTWVERKQSAVMQDRIGANRAAVLGIRAIGLFQMIADPLKLLFKENFVPARADKVLYALAPALAVIPVLLTLAVVPFGPMVNLWGRNVNLQISDLNIGFLLVIVTGAFGFYAVVLAGWASGNNYTLIGAFRGAAQLISYELVLGLSVIGTFMVYQSLSLYQIGQAQGDMLWGFLPKWGIIVQPLAFLLFLTASVAENKRVPFDLPEGESEIIGFSLEYSGMRFAMFWMGEFAATVVTAALGTALFLGGWQFPYLLGDGFHFPGGTFWALPWGLVLALQIGSFLVKVLIFCWLLMLIRWTLPRFRYDQLMKLGWKYMIPLALVNILITGLLISTKVI